MNYDDFIKKIKDKFNKEHEYYLKYWVIKLGIADWKIYVKDECNIDDIKDGDAVAETVLEEVGKVAYVTILSKSEAEKLDVIYEEEYDYEYILVHELLHIKFCFLYNPSVEDVNGLDKRILHQIIDDLARALIHARRDKNAKYF